MTIPDQSIDDAPAPRKESSAIGLLIFSFMMMIILSIAAIQPLIPNDFFPYLRIGEEILRDRSYSYHRVYDLHSVRKSCALSLLVSIHPST